MAFIVGLYLRKSSAAGLTTEKSGHHLDGSCNTSKVCAEADGECNGLLIYTCCFYI